MLGGNAQNSPGGDNCAQADICSFIEEGLISKFIVISAHQAVRKLFGGSRMHKKRIMPEHLAPLYFSNRSINESLLRSPRHDQSFLTA
jgi:hypothetical protein